MAKVHPEIDEKLRSWVEQQKMFFVSTAPLAGDGLINCSPKGMDTFRILGPNRVGYLDLTGSGVETIAHLKENKRIVIMFCGFEGKPQIVRFHGTGTVHEKGTAGYEERLPLFNEYSGARSIIEIDVKRVSDSCGYSVPLYEYKGDRDVLLKWSQAKGDEGVRVYQQTQNQLSIDGLSGVDAVK